VQWSKSNDDENDDDDIRICTTEYIGDTFIFFLFCSTLTLNRKFCKNENFEAPT